MSKIEELSKLVSYNPNTGVFIWIDRNKGRLAGSLNAEVLYNFHVNHGKEA